MSSTHDIGEARQRLAAAYDPARYRQAAHAVVDLLADYLARAASSTTHVLNWRPPLENVREAGDALRRFEGLSAAEPATPEQFVSRVRELATLAVSRGQTLHDPRYVGHQVPPPLPIAAVFEAIASATNQAMAIYEMGPWATGVEETLVSELGEAIGFPRGSFAGFITSGGSLANLTALLTARNVALGDVWRTGLSGGTGAAPVIVAHAEAHYCIARAAGVLGIGSQQVIKAALDERQRIDVPALEGQLRDLRAQGRPIIAVVASACTTRTGAFDALPAIADVCAAHKVWLHVDAAHGGAACLSPRHRHLVEGLHRADSVVLDAHKMLHVPALCTFVFYRDAAKQQHLGGTTQRVAPRVVQLTEGAQEVDPLREVRVDGVEHAHLVALGADAAEVDGRLAAERKAAQEAAGDARRGQSLVVWAINEGREAARECDRYLMGSTVLP